MSPTPTTTTYPELEETNVIEIRFNNCASNDPCGLCGAGTDPHIGPELFAEGTWKPVCHDCANRHRPDVLRDLDKIRAELLDQRRIGPAAEAWIDRSETTTEERTQLRRALIEQVVGSASPQLS